MSSPYAPRSRRMAGAPDVPAASQDGLRGGIYVPGKGTRRSASSAFGANGEINASSTAELMQAMSHVLREAQTKTASASPVESTEQRQARVAELRSAYHDKSGDRFQVLGEVISDEIWETLGREGIARRLFALKPLAQGETARVRVRKKDVVAWQVTADVNVQEARIRQFYIYPAEYYLLAKIVIEDKEIMQASADLMDEKFQDGLEAIMRREDLVTRELMINASTVFNDLVLFSTFTPSVLSMLKTQVARWATPAAKLTIAIDIWDDITADSDFVQFFDPVHKHELILEGRLGSLLGMEILTDGFRYDTLQVLEAGEAFVTAAPPALGVICTRKELDAQAISLAAQGRPARGWFMEQIQAQALGNGRAVARATRT